MQRGVGIVMLFALGLLVPRPAAAEFLCTMFGRCLYESPGFRLTVVDKETGQPLADVHALAEWVLHGPHGRNGPLMVQDAVSGPDGVLAFPAWGPIQGPLSGLILNHDPVITLFRSGYKTLLIVNAYPEGTEETTRLRRFGQDGQAFALEPFLGSPEGRVEQIKKAAWGAAGKRSDDQFFQFRAPYLNRIRRVWTDLQNVPQLNRDIENYARAFEDSMKYLEGLRR